MEDAEAYTNKQNTQSASPLKPSTVMLETYQTLKQRKYLDFKSSVHNLINLSESRTIPTLALSTNENPLSHTKIWFQV
jgi:hypothetical protein